MTVHILIPVRYESSRFPGKAFADLNGKLVIQWVYEEAEKVANYFRGDIDIHICILCNIKAYNNLASKYSRAKLSHTVALNGTERCAFWCKNHNVPVKDTVIIWQADEPTVKAESIIELIEKDDDTNLYHTIINIHDKLCENDVVVNSVSDYRRGIKDLDEDGFKCAQRYYKHVGVYRYNVHTLLTYLNFPQSSTEIKKKLEQCRWNWIYAYLHGNKIQIDYPTKSINVPEDIEHAAKILSKRSY